MATTVVKTIRVSGGDYTTLSAWEAANQGDLVTADEIRVAECYNDWPSGLSDTLTIDGSTTDATRYMMITVAAGHRHTGTPGTGFNIRKTQNFNALITVSDDYTAVEWLDVINAGTSSANAYASNNVASTLRNCLLSGGTNAARITQSDSVVDHCLAYGSTNGFQFANTRAGRGVYNSVAANCTTGFVNTTGSDPALKNCVAYNNTTGYSGSFDAASSNNASSAASGAPGTSPVHSITSAAFVDSANNDFHLAAGSVLIGAGANLYSTFTTDIDGDAWPSSGAWDIGFDYYVSSGGSTTIDLTPATFGFTAGSPQVALRSPLGLPSLNFSTNSMQPSLRTPLSSAAIGFTAQDISLGGGVVMALETAALGLTANTVQPALAVALSAAAANLIANSVQPAVAIRLTAAALSFTAQAVTLIRDTLISLTAATLNFTARAIEASGAIAAIAGDWLARMRRRRDR